MLYYHFESSHWIKYIQTKIGPWAMVWNSYLTNYPTGLLLNWCPLNLVELRCTNCVDPSGRCSKTFFWVFRGQDFLIAVIAKRLLGVWGSPCEGSFSNISNSKFCLRWSLEFVVSFHEWNGFSSFVTSWYTIFCQGKSLQKGGLFPCVLDLGTIFSEHKVALA